MSKNLWINYSLRLMCTRNFELTTQIHIHIVLTGFQNGNLGIFQVYWIEPGNFSSLCKGNPEIFLDYRMEPGNFSFYKIESWIFPECFRIEEQGSGDFRFFLYTNPIMRKPLFSFVSSVSWCLQYKYCVWNECIFLW